MDNIAASVGRLRELGDAETARREAAREAERVLREQARQATEAASHAAAPLAPQEAWASRSGPRLRADLLQGRLAKYRVDEKFRADVEAELGGECVELIAFARSEIFFAHAREKKVMAGAKRTCADKELQGKLANAWVRLTFPLHLRAAIASGRVHGEEAAFLEPRRIRKGNPTQRMGVALKLDDLVEIYRARAEGLE